MMQSLKVGKGLPTYLATWLNYQSAQSATPEQLKSMTSLLVTTHQRGNAHRTHQRPHYILKKILSLFILPYQFMNLLNLKIIC